MKIVSIFYYFFTALAFSTAYSADNFPYSLAGLKWSKALDIPTDGRVNDGFSNGCAKLDVDKKVVLEYGSIAYDRSMCFDENKLETTFNISEAAMACEKIGGRLPTDGEYQNVIAELGRENREYIREYIEDVSHTVYRTDLSESGLRALSAKFGNEDIYKIFWTSTLDTKNNRWNWNMAYVFNGGYGYVSKEERRDGFRVRCVK